MRKEVKKIGKRIVCLLGMLMIFFGVDAQSVYVDNNFPDVKIYEVSSSIFADVVVYKAPNSIYSGVNKNTGIWYFTSNPTAANVSIGYVSSSIFADLNVYFTDSAIFAKWNNSEKRKWFASKLSNYTSSFENYFQTDYPIFQSLIRLDSEEKSMPIL